MNARNFIAKRKNTKIISKILQKGKPASLWYIFIELHKTVTHEDEEETSGLSAGLKKYRKNCARVFSSYIKKRNLFLTKYLPIILYTDTTFNERFALRTAEQTNE